MALFEGSFAVALASFVQNFSKIPSEMLDDAQRHQSNASVINDELRKLYHSARSIKREKQCTDDIAWKLCISGGGGNLTSSSTTDATLRKFSRANPRRKLALLLLHLNLSNSSLVTDSGLLRIKILKTLRLVDVSGCSLLSHNAPVVFSMLPDLQDINVSACRQVNDFGVMRMANLKQLHCLNFSYCNITDVTFAHLAPVSLRHLNLSDCRITDVCLKRISCLLEMKYLDLTGCYEITDQGLECIVALQNLQHLDLTGCSGITDDGFLCVALLRDLRHLALRNCNKLSDVALANISSLTQLKHLDVSWCEITMDGLANVVNSLTRLEHLDLNFCRRIFAIGYSNIASLTHLHCLDLGGSSYVTDDVVNCLSSSLKQLVRLDVSKSSITDVGLASISSMVHLVHLSLLFCDRITDNGIATLSSLIHMVNFKLGVAPSAARITGTGVVAAVASMLQLQLLDVSGFRTVDLMLPTIADLHQLQVLDVSMCSSISYAAFVGISKLPDLKLLKRVGCAFEHDCVELLELMKRKGVILQ